ncbi:MAG: SHOCT domain-containing protein [Myxococcales bacterium]|nr:SHOCT domain-containing protein [Myxococcales bacterium]HIK84286.1 SHOCT domain-containing protein [Myxococcales bacterium]
MLTTDVSFSLAVQAGNALADPLRKLNQLLERGVLTAEEYVV